MPRSMLVKPTPVYHRPDYVKHAISHSKETFRKWHYPKQPSMAHPTKNLIDCPACPVNFFESACTGKKKAVCIGINYEGQRYNLQGCINDAERMLFSYMDFDVVSNLEIRYERPSCSM